MSMRLLISKPQAGSLVAAFFHPTFLLTGTGSHE
jgi:hypothetical protein